MKRTIHRKLAAGLFILLTAAAPLFMGLPAAAVTNNSPATQNNPVGSKSATNCNSNQTATQITSGNNKGQWYCAASQNGGQPSNQQGGSTPSNGYTPPNGVQANNCQGNSCLKCHYSSNGCQDSAATPNAPCGQNGCDLVQKYVNPTINVLSIIVGLIAVISIISGALMYITASGDPQKTSNAKNRIQKTIFAFVAYIFLYAFLQFLVPGGVF